MTGEAKSTIDIIEKILSDNEKNLTTQVANDNSEGQIVISGKNTDLEILIENGLSNEPEESKFILAYSVWEEI